MKYVTRVHRRFEVDGQPFVYAAESAALAALDEAGDELLAYFGAHGGADLDDLVRSANGAADEKLQAFDDLVTLGLLQPLGEVPAPPPDLPPMPYPLATLVLNVTNKCNLSCTYCYEYGEDKITDVLNAAGEKRAARMSVETARKSVDLLLESSTGRSEVSITFFGGETLLNFPVIRETVTYAEERARECGKRVGFSLTTNATLLTDEIASFLVEHHFGVNVSIDGAKPDQDRHRAFKSGSGSYDEILPRIRGFLERNRENPDRPGRPIGARVTLTRESSSPREIYAHLREDLGFDMVGFAPVTSAADRDYALDDGHLGDVLDAFGALADDYVAAALENRQHGFSNLHDLLQELHEGTNKAHPCGAGLGLLGVSTEGELGLCHRFVESGAHEVGDLEHGIDAEKRADFLRKGHISQKVACHDCFARPHCSGGCYHEAYVRYKDASQPNLHYCEWVRAWTDLGLRSYGRIANENPAFLERFEPRQDKHRTEEVTL